MCWLLQGKNSRQRFEVVKRFLRVYLGADDLQDAYHGCPNDTTQLCFCMVAIMNPHSKSGVLHQLHLPLRAISCSGEFNRLLELLTAVSRRVGIAPSWLFFDDQGTLDFIEE